MGFKDRPSYKYINFAVSFGLTMAITVYLLFHGGQWIDGKLGTEPMFAFIGVLLAVTAVFRRLMADIKTLDAQDDNEE